MPFYNLAGGGSGSGVQAGIINLGAGVSSRTVTFGTAYSDPPSVLAEIVSPAGSPTIGGAVQSISATQFVFQLDASTGNTNYQLVWHAAPAS